MCAHRIVDVHVMAMFQFFFISFQVLQMSHITLVLYQIIFLEFWIITRKHTHIFKGERLKVWGPLVVLFGKESFFRGLDINQMLNTSEKKSIMMIIMV